MGKGKKRLIVEDVTCQNEASGKVGPIFPSFQHAECNPEAMEKAVTACSVSVDWGTKEEAIPDPQKKTEVSLDVSIETETNKYYNVKSSKPASQKYFNTFLAIRNKKTGKTRLVEANEVVLTAVVRNPPTTNPLLLQQTPTEKTPEKRVEKSKHLIKSFGQSKGTNYYVQQDNMKVDTMQIEDNITKAADDVTLEDVPEAQKGSDVSVIPKRNEEAKSAYDVYLVKDLLTETELNELIKSGEGVLQDWKSEEELDVAQKAKEISPLGAYLLKKIINSSEDVGDKVALALYMEGIIKLSKLKKVELNRGEKSLPAYLPRSVKQKILSKFSLLIERSRLVTPEMKDRAICHVMILALLIGKLMLDVSLFSESIRVRSDHLKKLVSTVGGHLVSHEDRQTVALKIPLTSFSMEIVEKKTKKRK